MYNISKIYIRIQGIQKALKGPRYPKVTYGSRVSKSYIKVQSNHKVPKGPRYQKVT